MEGLFLLGRHGKTLYAEDLGLAFFANRFKSEPSRQQILRFIFSELKSQLQYLYPTDVRMIPYSKRGGIDIPFLLEFKNSQKVAVSVEGSERISDKTAKGMTWLQKIYPQAKTIIFHRGTNAYLTSFNTLCLPWTWIC